MYDTHSIFLHSYKFSSFCKFHIISLMHAMIMFPTISCVYIHKLKYIECCVVLCCVLFIYIYIYRQTFSFSPCIRSFYMKIDMFRSSEVKVKYHVPEHKSSGLNNAYHLMELNYKKGK